RLEAPGHGSLPSPFGRRSDRRAARSRPFVRNRSHARAEVRRTLTHLPYSFCDPFVPATRYHRCRWVVAIIQRRCVLRSPPGCSLCFALCAMKRRKAALVAFAFHHPGVRIALGLRQRARTRRLNALFL